MVSHPILGEAMCWGTAAYGKMRSPEGEILEPGSVDWELGRNVMLHGAVRGENETVAEGEKGCRRGIGVRIFEEVKKTWRPNQTLRLIAAREPTKFHAESHKASARASGDIRREASIE